MSLLQKIGLSIGIVLGGISYANAQENQEIPKDTAIVEYNQDTLRTTRYEANVITKQRFDPLTIKIKDGEKVLESRINLAWQKITEYDEGFKNPLVEREVEWKYGAKRATKPSNAPKNFENRIDVIKSVKYEANTDYEYDESGRPIKIEKGENNERTGQIKTIEHFEYPGEQPLKWIEKDPNINGVLDVEEGEKMYMLKGGDWKDTENWKDITPEVKEVKEEKK